MIQTCSVLLAETYPWPKTVAILMAGVLRRAHLRPWKRSIRGLKPVHSVAPSSTNPRLLPLRSTGGNSPLGLEGQSWSTFLRCGQSGICSCDDVPPVSVDFGLSVSRCASVINHRWRTVEYLRVDLVRSISAYHMLDSYVTAGVKFDPRI
jgi:hypothetical protein